MSGTAMWPLLLDMTRDDCKRTLRQLELSAYATIVSAFRAQGPLNKDKKHLLYDLQNILSISTERHRAEVRRAVNDEKLNTIADQVAGNLDESDWQLEGRRLVPLMPRLVPQTAFSPAANNAAAQHLSKNLQMPLPPKTANKEVPLPPPPPPVSTPPAVSLPRPSSPLSNVVILPSGMSIHIKGGLSGDEDEVHGKRHRRSSSVDSLVVSRSNLVVSTAPVSVPSRPSQPVTVTTATPAPTTTPSSPVKKVPTKSPVRASVQSAPVQKVILVSTATAGTAVQKSISAMKSSTSTPVSTVTSQPRTSIILPSSSSVASSNGNLGSILTVAGSMAQQQGSMTHQQASIAHQQGSVAHHQHTVAHQQGTVAHQQSSAAHHPSSISHQQGSMVHQQSGIHHPTTPSVVNTPRPRTKTVTAPPRMRQPQVLTRAGLAGSGLRGTTPRLAGASVLPQHGNYPRAGRPTIHIKQEGSMKIITQGAPTAGGKILPRPATPVSMSSALQSHTITTKTTPGHAVASGKVVNITPSGRIITSKQSTPNVVTVNPKTLQLTAIKGSSGTTVLTTGRSLSSTTNKPNVIVVQKAQGKRGAGGAIMPTTISLPRQNTSAISSPFEKELVSFIQRQDSQKQLVSQPQSGQQQQQPVQQQATQLIKTINSKQMEVHRKPVVLRQQSDGGEGSASSAPSRTSLLAELIQAVGIAPDATNQQIVVTEDSQAVQAVLGQQQTKDKVQHQWVEYDAPTPHSVSADGREVVVAEGADASAITALLNLHASSQAQRSATTTSQTRSNINLMPQQEIYTLDHGEMVVADSSGRDGLSGTTIQVIEAPQQSVQISGMRDIAHLGQDILGELDPDTGILYTTAAGGTEVQVSSAPETVVMEIPASSMRTSLAGKPVTTKTVVMSDGSGGTAHGNRQIDFLSSVLTQANIDLESYQYVEDGQIALSTSSSDSRTEIVNPPTTLVSILNPPSTPAAVANTHTVVIGSSDAEARSVLSSSLPSSSLAGSNVSGGSLSLLSQALSHTRTPTTAGKTITQQRQRQTFVPIQEASRSTVAGSSITVTHHPKSAVDSQAAVEVQQTGNVSVDVTPTSNVAVAVQPTGLDMAQMKMEDFTSQRLEQNVSSHSDTDVTTQPSVNVISQQDIQESGVEEVIEEQVVEEVLTDVVTMPESDSVYLDIPMSSIVDVGGDTEQQQQHQLVMVSGEDGQEQQLLIVSGDSADQQILTVSGEPISEQQLVSIIGETAAEQQLRLGKRKRKAPTAADELSPPAAGAGWARHALSLLQRVSRFRGQKDKGEMNAASWFTRPVDPQEVPDYYQIIKQPMDFSTIRKKLEMNQYSDWDEFHSDMLQIRENCLQYNPTGSLVRQDCEQVFVFYNSEYEKTVTRWQQQGLTLSPAGKKIRQDRSPIR